MSFGKVHTFSIIMLRTSDGYTRWYKTKKGRSIDKIVIHFMNRYSNDYKWLKIFEYKNGSVGRKYFYHTQNGSYGFN